MSKSEVEHYSCQRIMIDWNSNILQTKRKQSIKISGIERKRGFGPTGVNQSWQRNWVKVLICPVTGHVSG